MFKSTFNLVAIVFIVGFTSLSYGQDQQDAGKPVSVLFVQTAKGVTFSDGSMTLKGISPTITFFRIDLKDWPGMSQLLVS